MTEQAMTGVGAELRRARETQGLEIDDVAQQLKFAPRQIESLETERFDRLPGPTIARGMVRNYARLLKLDPEPLVQRMAPKDESAAGIVLSRGSAVPLSDGGQRSTLLYAGFSIAVLALVGLVAYEWHQESGGRTIVARPKPPPQIASAQVRPSPVRARPKPAAPIEKPGPANEKVVAKSEPAPVAAAVPAAPPTQPPIAPSKPAPAAPSLPTQASSAPLPAGVHRIELRCEEESWLEVRDANGSALISSLNPAGAERAVRGRAPLELVIGNAPHVTLLYDGKPVDLKPHTRGNVARFTLP